MEIKVYGPGCVKCEETEKIVRQIVEDMQVDASVEKISDPREMMMQGIMSTPAVAIDGKVVSKGRVPGRDEVKEWLVDKV